ncbi:MAG: 16S rRNA (guanine(966)-N(2))-methyltransferase RsmD [Acidimicrobiia bacterium]
MRVIAGLAKGRRLVSPATPDTRPLTDRAKEGVFSSLGERVEGARVLDLYAGSGALGIEALSRGAATCVLVERGGEALEALHRNVESVDLGGKVAAESVEAYLANASGAFDLAFVDPPWATDEQGLAAVLEGLARVMAPGGSVVVHRKAGAPAPRPPESLRLEDQRRYGDAGIYRYVMEPR